MDSAVMLAIAICVFVLGYRFYSKVLSTRLAPLDKTAITPAFQMKDGKDYLPMTRTSVFFYHYATIAGSGVLIGPTLAAQYGWMPCIVWILTATCLAGGVHDFVVMLASVRNEGKSIGQIAFKEVGKVTGGAVTVVILFMIITAISGLCLGTVVALEHNPWAVFTVFCTIPIAFVIGAALSRRPGAVLAVSCIGIVLLLAALFLGYHLYSAGLVPFLDLTRQQLTIIVAVYAFVASMLPVHVLLQPRDYLSAYLKVGVIIMLVLGIFLVHPTFNMPAVTPYISGGGPVVAGALWPFLFIVITCGAISGWHTLCCSGVSPKLIRGGYQADSLWRLAP
jgi:carbon starvation protein